jgi:hypothetical protein
VHRKHDVFVRSLERDTKLKLTFFSRKLDREVVSLCAPLHYSKNPVSPVKESEYEQDCYYFWDFGAEKGNNFLALSSSRVVSMELTDDVFHVQEFYNLGNHSKKSTKSADTNE